MNDITVIHYIFTVTVPSCHCGDSFGQLIGEDLCEFSFIAVEGDC